MKKNSGKAVDKEIFVPVRYSPFQKVEDALKARWYLRGSLLKRYRKVIVARAVAAYLEDLNNSMVDDDLYDDIYENQDGLTPRQARKKGITDRYPNLTYAEKALDLIQSITH